VYALGAVCMCVSVVVWVSFVLTLPFFLTSPPSPLVERHPLVSFHPRPTYAVPRSADLAQCAKLRVGGREPAPTASFRHADILNARPRSRCGVTLARMPDRLLVLVVPIVWLAGPKRERSICLKNNLLLPFSFSPCASARGSRRARSYVLSPLAV
jgi:hypothetical protein